MGKSKHGTAGGKITRGISPNTLVERTIEFVATQLPLWRDDPTRPSVNAENQLNIQLSKFLDSRARAHFAMALFHHEEHQGKRRRVDLSAGPTPTAIKAMPRLRSIYEPFLVLEGKRIPAPSAAREREYVTGFAKRSGGIQRFKVALHGANHDTAVMIGYVQANELAHWRATINRWIGELAVSGDDVTCNWTAGDALQALREESAPRTSRCESRHARTARREADEIRLVHLWVRMTAAT
jgi:hypothetical protein